jgi:hypothetical protein
MIRQMAGQGSFPLVSPARRCPDLQRDWAYHRPHLHLYCARTYLICTRTGLHSIHVCTGTGLIAPITA